jgi:hypothetical protein
MKYYKHYFAMHLIDYDNYIKTCWYENIVTYK